MTATNVIKKLLKCKGIKISDYNLSEPTSELHLWVQPHKNGSRCQICLRRSRLVTNAKRKERLWIDVPLGDWSVIFHYCPKEVICPTHGRLQEDIPWANLYSRITYRFEFQMLCYASEMTLTAATGLLRIPLSTLSGILHKTVSRIRDGHEIKDLTSVGVDEISYKKGRKFATIVYDLERSKVVWIGKGKAKETINHFFKNVLGPKKCLEVKTASCDMAEGYIRSIEAHCKNATLVLDRFHVVKAINEALDEVRKEAWREMGNKERKGIKGLRWLLYRHSRTRKKSDTHKLKELSKKNNRIYRAWVLKDEFEQIWNYRYKKCAEDYLQGWITKALRSRIDPIKKFARTMRKNFHRITAFSITRVTNAVAEGLNRIIKIIKNRASGFSSLEVYSDMIYLKVGDVNIPDQIPEDFRTECFGS